MRKYILILLIFAVNFASNAQVETTIFSGGNGFKEFSFLNNINKEEIQLYEMPSFNLDSIIQEEKELDEKGIGRPFRFGYAFDVNYGMEHGKWFELENKNIWSIRFKSDGAYTLNFRFFDLKLYNNSELYIYNSDGTVIYGPVTCYRRI